jgi:MFS family permease
LNNISSNPKSENKKTDLLVVLWLDVFCIAFCCLALRFVLLGLSSALFPVSFQQAINSYLGFLMLLPAILFLPLSGWLCDHVHKGKLLIVFNFFQVLSMGVVIFSLLGKHFFIGMAVGFGFVCVQFVFSMTTSRAILKDLCKSDDLSEVVGWTEACLLAGLITGCLFGGWAFDLFFPLKQDNPWTVGLWLSGMLLFLNVIALAASLKLKTVNIQPVCSQERFRWSLLFNHYKQFVMLYKKPVLFRYALFISVSLGLGIFLSLTLIESGMTWRGAEGSVSIAAIFVIVFITGVSVGSLLLKPISFYLQKNIPRLLIQTTCAQLILAGGMYWFSIHSTGWVVILFLLGLVSGISFAGLLTCFQHQATGPLRSRLLATQTLLANTFCFGATVLYYLIAHRFDCSPKEQLLFFLCCAIICVCFLLPSLIKEAKVATQL